MTISASTATTGMTMMLMGAAVKMAMSKSSKWVFETKGRGRCISRRTRTIVAVRIEIAETRIGGLSRAYGNFRASDAE
ncbi:AAA domain-containing protein [Psidium guajava]|nr:AAA domain-containing protein [Psidium guajava]